MLDLWLFRALEVHTHLAQGYGRFLRPSNDSIWVILGVVGLRRVRIVNYFGALMTPHPIFGPFAQFDIPSRHGSSAQASHSVLAYFQHKVHAHLTLR